MGDTNRRSKAEGGTCPFPLPASNHISSRCHLYLWLQSLWVPLSPWLQPPLGSSNAISSPLFFRPRNVISFQYLLAPGYFNMAFLLPLVPTVLLQSPPFIQISFRVPYLVDSSHPWLSAKHLIYDMMLLKQNYEHSFMCLFKTRDSILPDTEELNTFRVFYMELNIDLVTWAEILNFLQ